jgi:RNA polymerase sigma-70 factor (ECF subfamily)
VSGTQAQIIAQAGQGNLSAFTVLVERYRAPLISYLYGLIGGRDEAEELAQEVFCRAWQNLPNLRQPERLVSWLYQTAHNLAISTIRRPKMVTLPAEPMDRRQERPHQEEEHLAIHRAVGELPEPFRAAVALKHFAGMSHEQIAQYLAVPEGTVRSRLSRAYERLRERLRPLLEE